MRDLSAAEVAALRAIADRPKISFRYKPRGPEGTILPSHAAILDVRGLIDWRDADRPKITRAGRELLDRLDRGEHR